MQTDKNVVETTLEVARNITFHADAMRVCGITSPETTGMLLRESAKLLGVSEVLLQVKLLVEMPAGNGENTITKLRELFNSPFPIPDIQTPS